MSRFSRHFAADVPRHMTAVLAVTSVLGLIQVGFRCASWISDSRSAREVLSRAVEEFAEQLDVCWIFVCTVGLCSAMAHWSRRGQDRIAAFAGIPFRRVVGPGFLLCLVALVVGTAGIGQFLPEVDSNRITWNDGSTWGAALRRAQAPWEWVEVQTTENGASLHRGSAESRATLPAAARGVDAGVGGFTATIWPRVLFLFLIGGLMLRAMRLETRRVTAFAFIAPVLGWILLGEVAKTAAALLGGSLAAILATPAAAAGITALGLLAIHRAEE